METKLLRKQILQILQQNAGTDRHDLATMVGASFEDVQREITAMEKEQIILGYGAIVNWESFETEQVTALIEVTITPQRGMGFDDIARRLYSFSEVSDCYLMSGGYDLMIIIQGQSLMSVARFVSQKIAPLEAVMSTRTHFILKKYKMDGHMISPEAQDARETIVL